MYKYVTLLIAACLICGMGMGKGEINRHRGDKSLRAGKSNIGHLYLYEKDPQTWDLVENGAWGKMMYRLSAPEFQAVFNGHWLEPDTSYTLMYYPDPWPGDGLICLGEGMTDEFGDVHIRALVNTCDLPASFDDNYADGAKIWLVLSDDVDCENMNMVGWNPTEYLFEYELITFDDTDNYWDEDTDVCMEEE